MPSKHKPVIASQTSWDFIWEEALIGITMISAKASRRLLWSYPNLQRRKEARWERCQQSRLVLNDVMFVGQAFYSTRKGTCSVRSTTSSFRRARRRVSMCHWIRLSSPQTCRYHERRIIFLLLCADKRATETLVIESEFQKPFIMYAQTIWPWSYLDLAI